MTERETIVERGVRPGLFSAPWTRTSLALTEAEQAWAREYAELRRLGIDPESPIRCAADGTQEVYGGAHAGLSVILRLPMLEECMARGLTPADAVREQDAAAIDAME